MKGIIKNCIPVVTVLAVLFFSASAQAAARCMALSHSRCAADDSCTRVEGYTTKSAAKVDAYCRVKSDRKGPAAKRSDKSNKEDKRDKAKAGERPEQEKKSQQTDEGSSSTKVQKIGPGQLQDQTPKGRKIPAVVMSLASLRLADQHLSAD